MPHTFPGMRIRALQIILLATAAVVAVTNPVFNGLSIVTLGCLAGTAFLAIRTRTQKP